MLEFMMIAMSGMLASAPVAQTAAAPADAASERQVCKSTGQTGTRFRKKTCRTARQWEQIAEASKRDAGELINRPIVNGARSN